MKTEATTAPAGLTVKQIAAVREAFAYFDRDADGAVTTSELGALMRSLGKMPSEADVVEMITQVDASGEGSFDLPAFLELMTKQNGAGFSGESICEAFKVFDKEGTGMISVAELRHVLTNLGEKMSPEEVDEMVREADIGDVGQINYEHFLAKMDAQE